VDIGKSIRHAKIDRDWNNTDLAEHTGMHIRVVQRLCYEENCSGATLRKLAEAFDMSVSELIALGETQ